MKYFLRSTLLSLTLGLLASAWPAAAQYTFSGAIGMPNYIFDNPIGVAVDNTNGWLYAANWGDNQILGFNIATQQYIFAVGNAGTNPGELSGPAGLAIDNSGNLYVSETGNNRVQRFTSNGTVDPSFNFGFPITGLNGPHGLAVDNSARDRLYVAEGGANRVAVYTRSGSLQGYITGLSNPLGVAVNSTDGTLYIANTGANTVLRVPYNATVGLMASNLSVPVTSAYHLTYKASDGRLLVTQINVNMVRILDTTNNLNTIGTIGSSGSGAGQFSQPSGIGVDNAGNAYVAEFGNNRIQSFNSSDNWQWTILTTVTFNGAAGVAVNENNGLLYACDYNNHRVQVFDRATGALRFIFSGTGANALQYPVGIAVGPAPNYFVYVTEASPTNPYAPHRVQVFNSTGVFTGISFTTVTAPYQIAVGSDGRVYLTDRVDGFVRVYNADFTTNYFNISVGTEVRGVAIDDINGRIYAINNNGPSTTVQVYLKANGLPDATTGGGDAALGDDVGEADHSATISNLAVQGGKVYITQTSSSVVYTIDAVSGALIDIFGSPGTTLGKFTNPVGVAVTSDGSAFYVGDFNNHRIQAFTAGFTALWANGSLAMGNANGAFSQPTDVTISGANSRVYIADRNNHRIQVFNASGGYLAKVDPGAGSGATQLLFPSGVFADGTSLYISDTGNNRIKIYDISAAVPTTNPTYSGTSFGTAELLNPAGLWVTATKIYVADQSHNTIQVYDKTTRTAIQQIGSSANLSQPADVAVDAAGNVFVADKGHSKLKIFDAAGTLIATIDGPNPGAGNIFAAPEGVFVDSNGVVYVTDTGNNRIVALSLCGGTNWATNVRAHWVSNTGLAFGASGQGGAQFNSPVGISMDPTTFRRIVADRGNQRAQIFVPLPYINVRVQCTTIADASGTYSLGKGVPNDAGSLPYDYASGTAFTVENLGNAALTLTSTPRVAISGVDASSFVINETNLSGANNTFTPQQTRTFLVNFRPRSSGNKSATLTIATNESVSTGRNSYTYTITGTSITPSGNADPNDNYTYTWFPVNGTNFQDPTNWSPNRTAPKRWDILQFGSTGIVSNVPADTVGAMVLSLNAKIDLQPAAAGTVLAIKGRVGTDLQLPSGHQLNIASDNAMEIHLVQVGGLLNGSITLGNATTGNPAHRFVVKATPVTFGNASAFTAKNISGNPFGTAAGNNLVVFANNSTFVSQSGGTPFGLAQPNSIVQFQNGSTYRHQQASVPDLDNRTYGNFEYDYNGTIDVSTAGLPCLVQNKWTIKQGTFRISNNQPINLEGDFEVLSGATFQFLPASGPEPFTLTGSNSSSFGGAGTTTFNANAQLRVSKSDVTREVTLTANLTIPGSLNCLAGDLNLNGNSIDLGTTGTLFENLAAGHLVKDNTSTFDYLVSTCAPCTTGVVGGKITAANRTVAGTLTDIAGLGMQMSDAASYTVTVERYHFRGDNKSIRRLFVLNGTATNSTLVLNYSDDEIPADVTEALVDFQFFNRQTSGFGWFMRGGTHDPAGNTVTLTNVTTINNTWAVGSTSVPLPVELLSFTANKTGPTTAHLSWITASEHNNEAFEIQKSEDGLHFHKIGLVNGYGTTNERHSYSFDDVQFYASSYYRLRQIDLNGSSLYSDIQRVETTGEFKRTMILFPNPTTHSITLLLPDVQTDNDVITLHLLTSSGVVYRSYSGTLQEVANAINADLATTTPGIYVVRLQLRDQVYTERLSKL